MSRPATGGALIAATLLTLSSTPAFADKPVVAVMPFGSPNQHNLAEMGSNAQPTFITALLKTKQVRVVDEKRIQGALARLKAQESGLFDTKQVKQLGKFLSADYVLAGKLSFTGDAYTMTVHVTNVQTLEIELAEDVDFRGPGKFRVAVRSSAEKIAAQISGVDRRDKKHEAFLNLDARHFHDTAEAAIDALKGLDRWRYEGEIDVEDPEKKQVHVVLRTGTPRAGMPLQVFEEGIGENDQPIGVVYVIEPDERGGGFKAKYIKEKDKGKKKRGDFGLGARVSNARYRYRIAVGAVEDEAEGNRELVRMFRDKLYEKLGESRQFMAKDGERITDFALEKDYQNLHRYGVDFLLTGRFIGSPGKRRADFKVISTVTGEVWGTLKFETRI